MDGEMIITQMGRGSVSLPPAAATHLESATEDARVEGGAVSRAKLRVGGGVANLAIAHVKVRRQGGRGAAGVRRRGRL